MMIAPGYVGIDISKANLDVFDSAVGRVRRIGNHVEPIASLVEDVVRSGSFVLFEATAPYDGELCRALDEANIAYARVNPAKARSFARAAGFLAKTDAVDARMLAAYGAKLRPAPHVSRSAAREQLGQLNRRRDQLVAERQRERTRRRAENHPSVLASLEDHLRWLDAAIGAVDAEIAAAIANTPELAGQAKLLRSVPGVGPVTLATLLSLLPELGTRSSKTIAALAGLAPINNDTGIRRGQRSIRGGRKRVRDALYVAAFVARRSPALAAFYQRRINDGKAFKVAIVATARKLLTILNAIARDRIPFHA